MKTDKDKKLHEQDAHRALMDNKAKKKYCDCTASLGDREIIIDFCNRCFGKIR